MSATSALGFLVSGIALVILSARPAALGSFWILNAIPLSLALTALIGSCLSGSRTRVPWVSACRWLLHTALAFGAYRIAAMRYAWTHAERGPDGLPRWAAGISVAFLPVLLVGASALFPAQSWRVVSLEVLVSIAGVALAALAMRRLTTAKVASKGLLMTGIPLILLLTFVGLVVHSKATGRVG